MAFRTSTPTTNNSVRQPNSRYVQGGTTTTYRNRLGWWERRFFEEREDDFDIVVSKAEEGRPDLIAFNLYEKPNLGWLVMQFNNIVDPETELIEGTRLRVPSFRRVSLGILTRPTGGERARS